jgi:hypothetical protein
MGVKAECIAQIKINGTNLSLEANYRGNKINITYQIGAAI